MGWEGRSSTLTRDRRNSDFVVGGTKQCRVRFCYKYIRQIKDKQNYAQPSGGARRWAKN